MAHYEFEGNNYIVCAGQIITKLKLNDMVNIETDGQLAIPCI